MIGSDSVIGVLGGVMECRRQELRDHEDQGFSPVNGDLGGHHESRSRGRRMLPADQETVDEDDRGALPVVPARYRALLQRDPGFQFLASLVL